MAGLVMVVLTLAGVGRGLAAASDMAASSVGVPRVAVPICHTRQGDGSIPADRTPHDCCEACALSAPATLADAPPPSGPAAPGHDIAQTEAMAWVPAMARRRTPRQSQGPPTA